ncbi:MAG: alpha-ribazole phosphatase, partial [Candidatus Rokubacteria bacterium]|nr:alpha-ribazole phosphatase [Candidatus Rokubacteria bacterium]
MRTTIYLVRHGSVVGAETRRFIGHLDVPLSPVGEAEAAALGRRLANAKLAAAYSSDLARTRRTAEILAAPHGLEAVPLPELRE